MFDLEWPWIVIIISLLILIGTRINAWGLRYISIAPPSKVIMSIVVSLAVLGSALFVVLSGSYAEAEQKWAFGAIGTILGYWLKK